MIQDAAAKLLDSHGLRKTGIRLRVVNKLQSSSFAVSQPELEQEFQGEADRVTIYRTLHSLEEKGLIHKIIDLSGVSRYALCASACNEHHHADEHMHFHCLQCGNVFCLEIPELPSYQLPQGYWLKHLRLNAEGTCSSCSSCSQH